VKVTIEAESQAELDEKRPELLKAIAGGRFDCIVKAKGRGVYADEKPALTPRGSPIRAENEIFAHFDAKWAEMIAAMKDEINEIIEG
jgi:hypothetical protein